MNQNLRTHFRQELVYFTTMRNMLGRSRSGILRPQMIECETTPQCATQCTKSAQIGKVTPFSKMRSTVNARSMAIHIQSFGDLPSQVVSCLSTSSKVMVRDGMSLGIFHSVMSPSASLRMFLSHVSSSSAVVALLDEGGVLSSGSLCTSVGGLRGWKC